MPPPRIAYRRAGSGPPLVLIHGLGATKLIWKPQLEALARERDVIALDMPGFGDSEPARRAAAPTAAALGADDRRLPRAGSGSSARTSPATRSAAGSRWRWRRPGDAASACLISPAGLWQNPLGPRTVNTRGVAQGPEAAAARRGPQRRPRGRGMLRTVVARPANVPAEDGLRMIRDWIEAPGYEASNAEMRRHVFEDPESVAVPVTIAWGELDRLVRPPSRTRRPPGSRFVVLEGCGHTPNWDDPELVTELLLESSDPQALQRAA